MAEVHNKILARMLDRLFAGLTSGPNLNCRPHSSRQRVDLIHLEKLRDLAPAHILWELLGPHRTVKVAAKVPKPTRVRKNSEIKQQDSDNASAKPIEEKETEKELSAEEITAQKEWSDQQALLSKLRVLADEARTYEQDTGVHALNVGFPLLNLPPGSLKSGGVHTATKRVLAPIAFVPISLSIRSGTAAAIEIACKGDGIDLVRPNMALLAWLEQQTGTAAPELFADEKGQDPWREIGALMQHIAKTLNLAVPESLQELLTPPSASASPAAPVPEPEKMVEPAPGPESNTLAPSDATSQDAHAVDPTPAVGPLVPAPDALHLQPAPRFDDEQQTASIVPCAVLGLFPMNNQGLLHDMQAMVEGESLDGPVRSFIDVNVSLDDVQETKYDHEAWSGQKRPRSIAEERFITISDPCQARAVRLVRECRGLVIHGPPGTGKSQTITNVIGDHLARGERVLLVCDKRTALDVVANRMEAMGLRSLCALVYDAQRDQRELYRSIRDQLETLTDAKSDEFADKKLVKVDAELEKLHAELTEYWALLAEKDSEHGMSFHELMGQWLSIPEARAVDFDPGVLINSRGDDFDKHEQDLKDVLSRGEHIGFGTHAWRDCIQIGLNDFLARPMDHWRKELAACLDSANATDATLHGSIPPFAPEPAPEEQAAARLKLARQLEAVIQQAPQSLLDRWIGQDIDTLRRIRKKVADAGPQLRLLAEVPVDPELALVAQTERLGLPTLSQQLGALEAYLAVASKWYGWMCFKRRSRAGEALRQYGLAPDIASAQRLRTFLAVMRARLVVQALHSELTGLPTGQVETVPEKDLVRAAGTHLALLDLLIDVHSVQALRGLSEPVFNALREFAARPVLIDGLRKSQARATAVSQLRTRLNQTGMFRTDWVSQFFARVDAGQESRPQLANLVENLPTLETVLRIHALLAQLPPPLRTASRTLLDQCAPAEEGVAAIRRAILAGEINDRLHNQQKLRALDPQRLRASFDRYRELDYGKQALVRDAVLHKWIGRQKERLLVSTGSRLSSAGADLRRRLTIRGDRALRLRQVVAIGQSLEGGDPLYDLRPVWLAGPETVAQIFPRRPFFDAVIFDEASQCRLEEALPVLTRATRVVIAGDPKQLPPTRFFESALAVSEDDEVETDQEIFEVHQGEIEDLLGAALSINIQQCYLDVHYRSYNADLIQFSNNQFYSSRLQPIPGHPSHRARFALITLYHADGVYKERTNSVEAAEVCRIVRDLLKRAEPPSIGIACFNITQRDLIVGRLDELAQEDKEFAARLADARARRGVGSFEGLFVKNLENVQGDERDHIIISTTYGPDAKGRFYRRFGPLGQAGGGRRLNVLVTRAREEVHLVTSIPTSIYRNLPPIPPGQTPGGGWLLFAYLRFAEQLAELYEKVHQHFDESALDLSPKVNVRPSQASSLFARALAERLAKDSKVGSDVFWGNDGFCVDVALHHPHHADDVTIGVLCDGSRFSQAEDPVEWDLFRTSILESQGWALHRLWTPHFFRDPHGCTQDIVRESAEQASKAEERDAIKVEKGSRRE
jgi:hypothetical protein